MNFHNSFSYFSAPFAGTPLTFGAFYFYFCSTFFGIWPRGVESLLSDFLSGDDDNNDDDVVIVNDDDHDDAHPLMTSSPQSILSVINVIVFAKGKRTRGVLFIFMLFSINNFT